MEDGFKIVIVDTNSESGRKLAKKKPSRIIYFNIDITNLQQVSEFFEKIKTKKINIDHCINLAGGARKQEFKGLENLDNTEIMESINLNLSSQILFAKAVIPFMKESSSDNKSISFISSINAIKDFGLPAYSASKAGLLGITKTLSAELGIYDIRVNCILPGTVLTNKTLTEPKKYEEYVKGSLLGRFASTEEIAEVVFCVSTKLTCITGQKIIADCGQSVKGNYENY